jgi:hypothetical protein
MHFPSDGSTTEDDESEEYTVRMLLDLGSLILVYRELLALPESKTAKSKASSSSSSSSISSISTSSTCRSRNKSGAGGGGNVKKAPKARSRRK